MCVFVFVRACVRVLACDFACVRTFAPSCVRSYVRVQCLHCIFALITGVSENPDLCVFACCRFPEDIR